MKNLQTACFRFWGQFGLPVYLDGYAAAYDKNGNITPPPLPYITFNFSQIGFSSRGLMTARVWTYSESFLSVTEILSNIKAAISENGTILTLDGGEGAVALFRGTPFIQYQPTEDQMLKVGYINVECRSYIV